MTERNDYIQKLESARDHEVTQRRNLAAKLVSDNLEGGNPNARQSFIEVQNTIEAIERAIQHEKSLAGTRIS
jgi:hypothetical protein